MRPASCRATRVAPRMEPLSALCVYGTTQRSFHFLGADFAYAFLWKIKRKTSYLDRTANRVIAPPRLNSVHAVDLVNGDGGAGDVTHLRGRKAPVKAFRMALLRAADRVNSTPGGGPRFTVNAVIVSEYRTTKQASVHDDRVDLKSKKGRVRRKGGAVRHAARARLTMRRSRA